jgi:hypothetical protein
MPRRPAQKPVSTSVVPITTALNISALAREHGVSRKTIQRRLQKGWRPSAVPAVPTPRTPAHPKAVHPVRAVPAGPSRGLPMPVTPVRAPVSAYARPPLGVVRSVLLLLAVAFYVFVACAAVHR